MRDRTSPTRLFSSPKQRKQSALENELRFKVRGVMLGVSCPPDPFPGLLARPAHPKRIRDNQITKFKFSKWNSVSEWNRRIIKSASSPEKKTAYSAANAHNSPCSSSYKLSSLKTHFKCNSIFSLKDFCHVFLKNYLITF